MSYGWDLTVHYRDNPGHMEVFRGALLNDTITAVAVISQETDAYGGRKVTRIPWDLIGRIETSAP